MDLIGPMGPSAVPGTGHPCGVSTAGSPGRSPSCNPLRNGTAMNGQVFRKGEHPDGMGHQCDLKGSAPLQLGQGLSGILIAGSRRFLLALPQSTASDVSLHQFMQQRNVLSPSPPDTIWQICAANVAAAFQNSFSHQPGKCRETGGPSAGSLATVCGAAALLVKKKK